MESKSGLPSEVNIWSKIRGVLFKEIKITDTKLELTPRQEKIFKNVHDFWNQEITGQKVHDFLFYDITATKVKNFLLKDIEIIDNIEL